MKPPRSARLTSAALQRTHVDAEMRSECPDYLKDVNEFLDTVLMECRTQLDGFLLKLGQQGLEQLGIIEDPDLRGSTR